MKYLNNRFETLILHAEYSEINARRRKEPLVGIAYPCDRVRALRLAEIFDKCLDVQLDMNGVSPDDVGADRRGPAERIP